MATESDLLGEGSYGKVKKTGSVATKYFESTQSLIQEYAAGRYLSKHPLIVNVLNINFADKSMTMELFDGSVRQWNPFTKTYQQQMHFLKLTLKALICLHDLSIVHGDLKPGNILVNWDKDGNITKLVIGDLGFAAPNKYSKVEFTAPLYRDANYEAETEHDIYSFGVMIIEIMGEHITRKVKKHKKDKIKYTQADLMPHLLKIKDDKLRELVIRMIDNDKTKRPTARYLLRHMFNETVDLSVHPGFPKYPAVSMDRSKQDEIKEIFRSYAKLPGNNVTFEIKRNKIGYLACVNYICTNKITNYILYASATLIILSSIFGDLGFSIKAGCALAKTDASQIYMALTNLLNDDDFLNSIFYTKNSCF